MVSFLSEYSKQFFPEHQVFQTGLKLQTNSSMFNDIHTTSTPYCKIAKHMFAYAKTFVWSSNSDSLKGTHKDRLKNCLFWFSYSESLVRNLSSFFVYNSASVVILLFRIFQQYEFKLSIRNSNSWKLMVIQISNGTVCGFIVIECEEALLYSK